MSLKQDFVNHVQNWCDCKLCPLHLTRRIVVISRGKIPAPVLFVGEAPGLSENIQGAPFVGESGYFLDQILEEVMETKPFKFAITNILGCIPVNEDDSEGVRKPTKQEAYACQPRVVEFIRMCNPKLIVCLGDTASKYLPPESVVGIPFRKLGLVHPSYILRLYNPRQPKLYVTAYNRFVLTLTKAIENI